MKIEGGGEHNYKVALIRYPNGTLVLRNIEHEPTPEAAFTKEDVLGIARDIGWFLFPVKREEPINPPWVVDLANKLTL